MVPIYFERKTWS